MIELIARGARPGQSWSRPLAQGQTVVLGRQCEDWAVSWDDWVSRRHAELHWDGIRLHVRQLPEAPNPIFFRGEERSEFDIQADDQFVIGQTCFLLARQQPTFTPEGPSELQARTVRAEELRQVPFHDAQRRLDLLGRLPGVIACAASDTDLYIQVVDLLLAGIPRADAVALVLPGTMGDDAPVQVLRRDGRSSGARQIEPSRRLVREAVERLEETVLHVWPADASAQKEKAAFTLRGDFDWAFCTPVRNAACPGWGIYVAGRFAADEAATALGPWEGNDLSDDLKFAELMAATLGALRQAKALEQRETVLGQFFSPEVLRLLRAEHPQEALQPRPAEVTVLFCDLRGFSRQVEQSARDLGAVLARVSAALEVMTQNILDRKGVIADFLGDAAMGFWGWPIDQPDRAERACRAALAIRTTFDCFATSAGHPLADFQVGIGVGSGKAVAGKIGAHAQAKVTVFGPVVNLASRLQAMTRHLRVPILIDEETATAVKASSGLGGCRCRRLAQVLPWGLSTPLIVSELLPRAEEPGMLTDEHLACYEEALDAFVRGEWGPAYEMLHRVPARDHGKDLLTGFILEHNHVPPPEWDGIIRLESK